MSHVAKTVIRWHLMAPPFQHTHSKALRRQVRVIAFSHAKKSIPEATTEGNAANFKLTNRSTSVTMQRETTVGTDAAYSLLPFAVDHNLIFMTARDHSLMVVLEHVRRTLPEFNFGIWRHLHSQRGITRLAGRRKAEGCVNKKRLIENGFQKKGKKDKKVKQF